MPAHPLDDVQALFTNSSKYMQYQALLTILYKKLPITLYLDKIKIVTFLLVLFTEYREVYIALGVSLQICQQRVSAGCCCIQIIVE